MITETMTLSEKIREMLRDLEELKRESMKYIAKGGFKELRRQDAQFPAFRVLELTSSRMTNYLVMLTFKSRKDIFDPNPLLSFRAIIETKAGKMLMGLSLGGNENFVSAFFYTPHLLRRYRERMGYKQEGMDLMKIFCKRNTNFVLNNEYRRKSMKDHKHVMLTCLDGAVFGYRMPEDPYSYVLSTFIANDTMQEGYKKRFNDKFDEAMKEGMEELGQLFPIMAEVPVVPRKKKTPKKQ